MKFTLMFILFYTVGLTQEITEFNNSDWRIRSSAINKYYEDSPQGWQLKKNFNNDEIVKSAFINLLEYEEKNPVYGGGEGYGEYLYVISGIVANLDDDRSFNQFIGKFFGRGKPVEAYLVRKGKRAIPYLLNNLNDSLSLYLGKLELSLEILGEILKPKMEGYNPTNDEKMKIKDLMVLTFKRKIVINYPKESDEFKSISSGYAGVRKKIVEAIVKSEDPDVIPILEEVAKTDEYEFTPVQKKPGMKGGKLVTPPPPPRTGQKIYPVREAAQKALEELKKKGVKYE